VNRDLTVLLGGRVVGRLSQGEGGALSFAYDDAYRESPGALPISLSLPLSAGSHAHRTVRAFCQGLLPDNEGVLERWGRDFQALGLPPTSKYQSDGGPSPEQIVALVRRAVGPPVAAVEVARFVDALALNWLIAGTDAHAKNYSVLLEAASAEAVVALRSTLPDRLAAAVEKHTEECRRRLADG
jgi:serine/threonine-protein kinase HipA